MKTFSATTPDKTSDPVAQLQVELRKLESTHIPEMSAQLTQARTNLLTVLPMYVRSRFDFGRVLYGYKAQFKAARGWLAGAAAIGKAIDRDGKTVLRIVSHYEEVMGLDPIFAEALAEQQVDPGAPKNTEIVQELMDMPAPASREQATATVAAVVQEHRALKKKAQLKRPREKKATEQQEQPEKNDGAADQEGPEEFTGRMVRIFERHSANMSTAQRKAEVQHTLIAVGRAFGIYLRRSILPPKPGQEQRAA